ncbi:MAG: hypothetical protein AAFR65_00015 [Pseudomonadota bacterium]
MLRFIRGLGQWVVLIGAVLSTVYAFRPDLRRWVETELVAREAYYYVGEFLITETYDKPKKFNFYSNRWRPSKSDPGGYFNPALLQGGDAFDVFRAIDNETLIALDTEIATPGRLTPEPTGRIETLAIANECYLVRESICRMTLPDASGSYAVREDRGCKRSEAYTDDNPEEEMNVYLWVRAVRYTCHG